MVNNYRGGQTMKFATILREAGFSIEEFAKCAEIPITLYDRKNRIIDDENLHFCEKLFQYNDVSVLRFERFLQELENGLSVDYMDIKINESHVIILRKGHTPKIFSRIKFLDID